MKTIILLTLLIPTLAFGQDYRTEQRLDVTITSILSNIVKHGTQAAITGKLDSTSLKNDVINSVGSNINSGVYDHYYEDIRQRHQQEYDDQQYQVYSRQRDRELGISSRSNFEKRYQCQRFGRC